MYIDELVLKSTFEFMQLSLLLWELPFLEVAFIQVLQEF